MLGQKVAVHNGKVEVEQLVTDGYVLTEAPLPALVTISNELGQPRYPTMRHIMAANRKRPVIWKLADLELDTALLTPQLEVLELTFPERTQRCEFIEAADAAEAARQLATVLRTAQLL
jgi:electron transfer flavoprotein beta subunit